MITIDGGTDCVPIAVFSIENTMINLKKLVMQANTNGNIENIDITKSICITGFISLKMSDILFLPSF